MYLVWGGLIAIAAYWNMDLITYFDLETIWKWGIFLAVFGTIIPPIAFTRGLPVIGTGLGSIISALEIPVSILSAHFVLGELVSPVQWIGIGVILGSIVLINLKK
jgi:drug/metabolite transporter (DMT)-like permease